MYGRHIDLLCLHGMSPSCPQCNVARLHGTQTLLSKNATMHSSPIKQQPHSSCPRSSAHHKNSFGNLDPRAKLLCTATLGILVWHAPPLVVCIYAACTMGAFYASDVFVWLHAPMLRSCLYFVLLWAGAKLFIDTAGLAAGSLSPQGPLLPVSQRILQALPATGLLALRLGILIALGMLLTLTISIRSLGLAFMWFLRPVMGRHAWRAALALALMIHFIPLIQRTVAQVRHALVLRAPQRSLPKRWILLPQATLRIMSQKTWTQTVAVAARGLDMPQAWRPEFTPQPMTWIACILFLLFATAPVVYTTFY